MKNKKYNWGKFSIRLPKEEDQKLFLENFEKSGAENLTIYVRNKLLDREFKVRYVNKDYEEIKERLNDIFYQIKKIGVNYNQAVKVLNQRKQDNPSNDIGKNLVSLTCSLQQEVEELSKIFKRLNRKNNRSVHDSRNTKTNRTL